MKSEERHQLEQNELADGMLRLSSRLRPFLPFVLIALAVTAAGSIAYAYWSQSQQQVQDDAWKEFFAAVNENQPEPLETLIARYPNAKAVPYARLRIADFKFERGKKALINNRTQALGLLDEAIGIYEGLTSNPQLDIQEQALYCQGLATESKGALGEAKSIYERVGTNFPNTIWASRADARIAQIDSPQAKQFYAQLAEFKPIQPSTDLPPLDDNPIPPPPSATTPTGEAVGEVPVPPTEVPAEKAEETPAPPAEEMPEPPKEETPAPPSEETPAPPSEETPAPPSEETSDPAAPATPEPGPEPKEETPATPPQ